MFQVLVVEDDQKLCHLMCTVLRKNGYTAIGAANSEEALEILDREYIDLIVTDIMMPGVDGCQLVEMLRQAKYDLPILMVTAKDSFADKQKSFLAGADDYMVKPIDVNEMILRVGALLRRAQSINEKKLVVGEVTIDFDAMTATRRKETIQLPQKEFQLLYKLLSFPNKIFTRRQLMDEIWGINSETDERTVDVHINRLRDHFKSWPDFEIQTVRGLGYKALRHAAEGNKEG